jgi:hypothetical protein
VPSLRRKHTNLRSIFESCAGNAKIVDWLAERSRFELSGDFEKSRVRPAETRTQDPLIKSSLSDQPPETTG